MVSEASLNKWLWSVTGDHLPIIVAGLSPPRVIFFPTSLCCIEGHQSWGLPPPRNVEIAICPLLFRAMLNPIKFKLPWFQASRGQGSSVILQILTNIKLHCQGVERAFQLHYSQAELEITFCKILKDKTFYHDLF